MGSDAGESEIDGGVLRSALPESEKVGFGFVETAGSLLSRRVRARLSWYWELVGSQVRAARKAAMASS